MKSAFGQNLRKMDSVHCLRNSVFGKLKLVTQISHQNREFISLETTAMALKTREDGRSRVEWSESLQKVLYMNQMRNKRNGRNGVEWRAVEKWLESLQKVLYMKSGIKLLETQCVGISQLSAPAPGPFGFFLRYVRTANEANHSVWIGHIRMANSTGRDVESFWSVPNFN